MPEAPDLDPRTCTASVVAARFQVSGSSAVRLGQKRHAGVDPAPAAVADGLRARLSEKPDLTMRALAAELRERGAPVIHDTVWRFVRRAGLTVRKDADRLRA